jgi:uncharacterized NAD-dependent epimerase/dehydratase family protein
MKEKLHLPTAIVLADGLFDKPDAKTSHGLVRGTERFHIAAVIDQQNAGKDAGEVLDGRRRGIPVFESIEEALSAVGKVDVCIIGVATVGGYLPPHLLDLVKIAIQNGMSVVNGLHEFLSEKPDIQALASKYGVALTDVRRPKPRKDLHFWTGEIFKVKAPVIAVLGTDCAVGKRTTARLIREACEEKGMKAEMIYTGQTGWMQGGRYGFIFDSTLNDFISGELEHAIVSCWKETQPDVILLEGQSSLFNPSGPCGPEYLISGNAKHTILVHAPKRRFFDDDEHWGELPPVEKYIELAALYGSKVMALALNTTGCNYEEAKAFQQKYQAATGLPVLLPVEEGVASIIPVLKSLVNL